VARPPSPTQPHANPLSTIHRQQGKAAVKLESCFSVLRSLSEAVVFQKLEWRKCVGLNATHVVGKRRYFKSITGKGGGVGAKVRHVVEDRDKD